MKKIFFLFSLLSVLFSRAQFPVTVTSGNTSTLQKANGAFGGTLGYVFAGSYGDTTAANLSFIKNVPGIVIRVVDSLWLRNNSATAWLRVGATADLSGYELQSNKTTSTTLNGGSANNTRYPSELAVKTYVDNAVSSVTPTLSQYQVGVGNASNQLSGNTNLQFQSGVLSVNQSSGNDGRIDAGYFLLKQIGGVSAPASGYSFLYPMSDGLHYKTSTTDYNLTAGSSAPSLTQYRLAIGDASNLLSTASAITGSRALISDANGVPTHSATTATELGYVNGVTSAIQTQIDSKIGNYDSAFVAIQTLTDTSALFERKNRSIPGVEFHVSLANGDKGDITVNNGWTNWTIDDGAVTNAKISAGIDAAKIADGSVSNTEFQRLDGITGNVQTQLDGKQPNIQFKDEGTNKGTSGGVTTVNFTGAGVTATHSSGTLTVNIDAGSSGSSTWEEIRFKTGVDTYAPVSGDSLFTHDSLAGKIIKVFRMRERQDTLYDYIFNNSTGAITFRPALSSDETVVIEAFSSGSRINLALQAPTTFETANRVAFYTNSSKVVSGSNVTNWANADGNTALDYSQSDSGYPQDGGSDGLAFDGTGARKLYMTSIPTGLDAPHTIYMRVKINAYPSALFSPSGSLYGVFFDTGNTYYNPSGGGFGSAVTSGVSSGTWHTVTITWDGSTGEKIYVDGTLLGTAASSPAGTALDFSILNAQSSGTFFNGNILGLAMFDVVHDATKVANEVPKFNTEVQ